MPNDDTNPKDLLGLKKVDMAAVPPVAIAHEALAFMDGEIKYGFRNYRNKKVRARVYVAAAMRHLSAWYEGEDVAQDSGVHHLGHARACLGIILDAEAQGSLIDDRSKGNYSVVAEQLSLWVKKRTSETTPEVLYDPNKPLEINAAVLETL